MEGQKDRVEYYSKIFLYLIFAFGILWHSMPFLKDLMLSLTPYTLLLSTIIVLYPFKKKFEKKNIVWIISVFVFTFLLEVIGVATGLVFGDYSYGDVLGIKLFNVPLIIGINWTLVVAGAIQISNKITGNKFLLPLLTGILAVLFDIFLEPVAIIFGYWYWDSYSIPLQNYIAWFVISFVAAALYEKLKIKFKNKLLVHYYFIQLVFFMTLNIIFSWIV